MATTTQTSSVDPALLPYLTQGLERAQSLFLTGSPSTSGAQDTNFVMVVVHA